MTELGRISEAIVEEAVLSWLKDIGYVVYGDSDVSPTSSNPIRDSFEDTVLLSRFTAAIRRINPDLPDVAIAQAVATLRDIPNLGLAQDNRWFHRLMTDGVAVEYRDAGGELRGGRVSLLNFEAPEENDFLVVHQFAVRNGDRIRRADLVLFVNGLPVIVLELKNPVRPAATGDLAYDQLQGYMRDVPALFLSNVLLAFSDGDSTRVGSLTASPDRFAPWRSVGDEAEFAGPSLEGFIRDLCVPAKLLIYIRHCVTFTEDPRSGEVVKLCAAHHQFRAVLNSSTAVIRAMKPNGDGRGGVVWHTQGSGKSLTMLMLASALVADRALRNPTIVVVTDRNDLDDQLFSTFASSRDVLRQDPEIAASRDDLRNRLNRASGGIVFTTIQKFAARPEPVSERANVVVIADEAHRSQYGFLDGGARWMRQALPNATFVGFTGTPLELDERSTRSVFGEYADVYDMRESVRDGTTVPIFYEMRLVKLLPDEEGIEFAKDAINAVARADDEATVADPDVVVSLTDLIGARSRLRVVAEEIVQHFEDRQTAILGKALVVCVSRQACMDLYDEITNIRPEWHSDDDSQGSVKVVMTGSASEGERVAAHARSKARRSFLASRFTDPTDELALVLVCDMWLTGFDCPPMHTIYLDKPLSGHNLMQALARVNRVFGDKPGGVAVDFLGIADQLSAAVQAYTTAGGRSRPVHSLRDEAIPVMQRDAEALGDFFEEFEYSPFVGQSAADQVRLVTAGVEYVLSQENGRERFFHLVASLSQAFALCVPCDESNEIRDHLAFYQALRAAMVKRLSSQSDASHASRASVRQLISGAVVSDGVIDLFQAAGLDESQVSILSDDFLDRLAGMPQKNLALEALKKLLDDEIRVRGRVNLVQARDFRSALAQTINAYNNHAITTAQVVEELIRLARVMRQRAEEGVESGLNPDEVAFYDALASNDSAREVLRDDMLREIARELARAIRSKASLDWMQRETVRADMRRTVRRLLARYGYPPDAQEGAAVLVMRQAELFAGANLDES